MPLNEATAETVHGLDGSLVKADWPPLTLVELTAILSGYPDAGRPTALLSVSPRPFSAASVVATDLRHVFVKRHARAVRDAAGLGEEHRFMEYLRAQGAPVARVFATAAGETAVESGDWTYEVHAIPAGADSYMDALSWTPFRSEAHARSAGVLLARLHRSASGFEAPARKGRPLTAGFSIFAAPDPNAAFATYVAARPALRDYLSARDCAEESLALLAPYHAELSPLLTRIPALWTHNDLHPSNLLWNGAGPTACATAVIDFGLADRTNPVHDLAHAIERSIVEWLTLVNDPDHPESVQIHIDHLIALLEGYDSVRRLTTAEAHALAPMLALCHAEFALSETDYFLSVLHSPAKAYFACERYLVLHARWFRGAGARLLDKIREWANRRNTHEIGNYTR